MKKIITLVVLLVSTKAFASAANFRFGPLSLLLGGINTEMDFQLNSEWTLGPQFTYMNYKLLSGGRRNFDFQINAVAFGARANWFRNGVFKDGLYVAPQVSYARVNVETTDSAATTYKGEASGAIIGCLVGYGWFWQSFNQMLGAGLSSMLGDATVTVRDSSGNVDEVNSSRVTGLALEYTIGWTF